MVPPTCLSDVRLPRYSQSKIPILDWLYLSNHTSQEQVGGTVGKGMAELCLTESGSKSLSIMVQELLSFKVRPIRIQHIVSSENFSTRFFTLQKGVSSAFQTTGSP